MTIRWGKIFFPIFILLFSILRAESPDSALKSINQNLHLIQAAADQFNFKPYILTSIIFAERSLNFDWKDSAFDIPLAQSGYNSSIGFCQVKIKTAYWIEVHLSDSTSHFYLGQSYHRILPISKTPNEIITKLENDSLNILYAAAYVKIIQNYWLKSGFSITDRPDILGTLYSAGIYTTSGKLRMPNNKPISNRFGLKVLESAFLFK